MHVRKLAGIVIVEGSIIENRNHLPLPPTLLDPRAFPIGSARVSTSNYRSLFPPSLPPRYLGPPRRNYSSNGRNVEFLLLLVLHCLNFSNGGEGRRGEVIKGNALVSREWNWNIREYREDGFVTTTMSVVRRGSS